MSDKLSINQEKLFNFLFAKIIELQKFVAELNSISDDFQNMIEDLLNR